MTTPMQFPGSHPKRPCHIPYLVSFPSVQQYAKDSFADDSFIMAAVTSSVSDHRLRFRNVGGAIRLKLRGSGIVRSISLIGNSHESLAGIADVRIAYESTPSVVFTTAAEKVTLDCGIAGVALGSSATDFIISLPSVEFTEGFTVIVEDINGHVQELTATSFNEVKRSSVLTMPEKTICFDQPENPEGLFMYSGYINADLINEFELGASGASKIYEKVTEDVLNRGIEMGIIVKEPLKEKGKTLFPDTPKSTILIFAIPHSSTMNVYKDLLNNPIPFDHSQLHVNGGTVVMIGNEAYRLYGEYQSNNIGVGDQAVDKYYYIQ